MKRKTYHRLKVIALSLLLLEAVVVLMLLIAHNALAADSDRG